MGAWGYNLLENDSIMDEIGHFKELPNKNKPKFLTQALELALKESSTHTVSCDDLPLDYEEGDKEQLLADLIDPQQDTNAREIFLGLIYFCLQETGYKNLVTRNFLEKSLIFVKELSNAKLLQAYNRPELRFEELFLFQEQIKRLLIL